MIKKYILVILLISIVSSLNCGYTTQSSCISVGCIWNNNTCTVGSGTCLTGYAFQNSTQQCVLCSELNSATCTSICTSYYYSSINNICQSCTNVDSNCLQCTSNQCFSCTSGYTPDPNYPKECLISLCLIRYCTQCVDSSTCYSCMTGHTPSTNGSFCSLSICSIANCLACLNNSACVTCQTGYQLSSDNLKCTLICKDPFCASCSTPTNCNYCYDGYSFIPQLGYCQLNCLVEHCSACDLSTTCTSCDNGYILNQHNKKECNKCTITNCITCSANFNTCDLCTLGFTPKGNTCAAAMCYITNCITCSSSVFCSQCNSISLLSSDKTSCIQNCLALISNCISCVTNTTCSACKPGFTLQSPTLCKQACNIANCYICLSSNICVFCQSGYKFFNGSCILDCGIENCLNCNSSKTCQTCNYGYQLSSSAKSCHLLCSIGYYALVSGNCQTCFQTVSYCTSCSPNPTNASNIICTVCADLYYLSGSGQCLSCSNAISNCLFCTGPTSCTNCAYGYVLLTTSLCSLPVSCNVANCQQCSATNSSFCTKCSSSYYAVNGICSKIICIGNQIYASDSLSCICPHGSFYSNRDCAYCEFDNCASCNSAGCTICNQRFFVNQGRCASCISNCLSCTTSSNCDRCDYGFILENGICTQYSSHVAAIGQGNNTNPSTAYLCPPGCASCVLYNQQINCQSALSGYSVDNNGSIIKCDDSCKSCASSNSSLCTSCYNSFTLVSSHCQQCKDPNALSCPVNINVPILCVKGYSPKNDICVECAANCTECGIAGALACDASQCVSGYTQLYGTTNCTKCLNSCASCSQYNPQLCLSCSATDYLNVNLSSCQPCPSVCKTCSSATICLTCIPTYVFSQNWCYQALSYPCSGQTNSTCTQCFAPYLLSSKNTCVLDISCNATSSCVSCQLNYYLSSKKCFPCQTDSSVCDYCNPKKPSHCLTCSKGYYFSGSSSTCVSCSTAQRGCSQCSTGNICTKARDSYFLEVDSYGQYTGTSSPCNAKCGTCSHSDGCDTCANSYNRYGSTCLYNKNIEGSVTLGPGVGSSNWFKNTTGSDQQDLASALLNLNLITQSLAFAIKATSPEQILHKSAKKGSIIIEFIAAINPEDDLTTASNNFQNIVSNNQLQYFSVVSSSLTVNGETSQSSTPNLGLILGITLPLVILLAVIIIFCKIYIGESDDKTTQETQKQIRDFEM